MSTGDIQWFTEGPFGNPGSIRYAVGTTAGASINPGEPVAKSLGGTNVSSLATNKPSFGTDFLAGVSQSFSNETTTASGVVDVYDIFATNASFQVAPNVAATWNTQAKYDALVGARVLLDKTSGAYTILSSDRVDGGCVVLPLDIVKHPGLVHFKFREGCNYLA